MSASRWGISKAKGQIQLKIIGTVDGKWAFPETDRFEGVRHVEVDLSEFVTMNSEGIRNWIQWHRSLDPAIEFSYLKAPSVFLSLASMISGLIADPESLKSFYVQYASADGRARKALLIEQTADGQFLIPQQHQGLDLDHLPAKDFRILAGRFRLV